MDPWIPLSAFLLLSSAWQISASGSKCTASTPYNASYNYFPFAYTDSFVVKASSSLRAVNSVSSGLPATGGSQSVSFTVEYFNSYKVVTNKFDDSQYLLYQCGTPAPTSSYPKARAFEIPLTSIALDSQYPVAYMELLGLMSTVTAMNSDLMVSPCGLKLKNSGQFTELLGSTKVPTIRSMKSTARATMYDITFYPLDEEDPLARAMWLKYLALFFNAESSASDLYSQIEQSYQCLNGSTSSSAGGLALKPVVLWMNVIMGSVEVVYTGYVNQLIEDAGGLTLDASDAGRYNTSIPKQAQKFNGILQQANIVIVDKAFPFPLPLSIEAFLNSTHINAVSVARFEAIRTKRVWSADRRTNGPPFYGNDFYEGALVEPQVVLQELINIFYPNTSLAASSSHYFFRNIAAGEAQVDLTAANCIADDPTAPADPLIIPCDVPSPPTVYVVSSAPPTPAWQASTSPPSSASSSSLTLEEKQWVILAAALSLSLLLQMTIPQRL
eukprot:TRINITY_DN3011_c0_g1_i2.p1 TRINITY_DN3011_c0_g1~~TRINITY_DN3011_c0_g1_i2.p1  ORF type:complete len:498 (+),score=101.70 TRINITY_DN3011_c0_g1_i2:27-1520(+)